MLDRAPRRPVRSPISVMVGVALALSLLAPGRGPGGMTLRGLAPHDAPAAADRTAAAAEADLVTGMSDDGRAAPADDDGAGLQPSVQYEEALRHESDRISFAPGKRVTVGFIPRAGDGWAIDGRAPTALPAGRLDGTRIREQGQAQLRDVAPLAVAPGDGSRPAAGSPADAGRSIAAIPAAYVVPAPAGDSGAATDPGTDARVSPDGLRKEIFGFLPYWQLNSSRLRLDYAKISTIAYFGVGVDAAGNLQKRNANGSLTVGWSGWTSAKLSSIIAAAHSARTRVVLTVQSFAWNATGSARQKALLTSPTARMTLARQIAAAVRDRGADGVNLDFEPLARGAEAGFTALVRSVRAELNKIHSGYQVTFDTTGSIGNYPLEAATARGGADAIFVMGYDYRTAGSSPVGSVAPYRKSGYDIVDTVKAYAARVAPSKLILGVPYYGRAWSTSSNQLNASNISGTKFGASTTVAYDTAADYLAQYGRRYDSVEGVAWTAYRKQNCTTTYGCVTPWRQLYVDDAAALSQKYALVNAYGLRGAGIWALGYDGTRRDLYGAIQRAFIEDTTPPVAAITILPARQMNPEFSVSWTGRDDVGVVSYDVERSVDGGPWAPWLTKTAQTKAVFDGDDGHAYAFRVRARDRKGNLSAFNVTSTGAAAVALRAGGFASPRVDGLSVRSAPDTSAKKLGTLGKGVVVAILEGPRSADGFRWYRISGPLTEWSAFSPAFVGRWVVGSSASTTYLSPATPPNATAVKALLGGLSFGGAGAASLGTGPAAVAARSFSPNGDGSRDGLRLGWTNGAAFDSLSLRVFRANGSLVGTVPLAATGAGPRAIIWNGKVGATRVPDGRYVVSLFGAVRNRHFYNPIEVWRPNALSVYGITVDTVAPAVTSATISTAVISPNGDGLLDTVKATIAGTGASQWAFGVAPLAGSTPGKAIVVRSGSGGSAAVTWNGVADGGKAVPDGTYRVQLVLLDAAGNRAPRSWTVRVDRARPAVTIAPPGSFSPNGDGAADTATISWSASEPITGTVRIYRGTLLIHSWAIAPSAKGATTWKGTNANGAAVADGTYTVRIEGRDAAGNRSVVTAPVIVDRTLSTLRWSAPAFFPQDGDGLVATSSASVKLARPAVVTGGIYSGSTLVRVIWSNAHLAAGSHAWRWNGRNGANAFVAPGRYVVRITATTGLGTTTLTRSVLVDAFDVSLSATTIRAGQTLTITLRTVEPLKAAPSVTFTQPGRAGVKKTATALGSGRYRVSFVVAAGAAGDATIAISGRDSAGGVNATTRRVAIQ